jgi:hypothetical protein
VRSWPAHQLHAWGNRHAEASARVHCNAFASPDDFVEVFSRRYDNLGKHTPVISTGAVVAPGRAPSSCTARSAGWRRAPPSSRTATGSRSGGRS